MTTEINSAYINALLADASYVELTNQNGEVETDPTIIKANLALRITQPLANFITTNFEVLNQEPDSLLDGFSATVWKGKTGTEYAGQVYVSTRGTEPGVDFVDDVILGATGVAYDQLVSMVNQPTNNDWRLTA